MRSVVPSSRFFPAIATREAAGRRGFINRSRVSGTFDTATRIDVTPALGMG